ncbi:MAG: hypothetical protein HOC79_08855 [Euryarchaeota archaeon]|jgi:hypothetical protein|nr:hypothetical protein [Euryarchaeota archaeon]
MQPPVSANNSDELRIFGLISFVAILVGSAIAVFDSGLWLVAVDTRTNALTYTMGAFTLQGMAYFLWKMMAQDSMDQKASLANMQKAMTRQMQKQQMGFAQKQMQIELKKQDMMFSHQLNQLEQDPEVAQYLFLQKQIEEAETTIETPPTHTTENNTPIKLGANQKRSADGKFKKKE